MAENLFVIRDFQDHLIAKAMKDQAFATQLRQDPKAAMQRELAAQGHTVTLPDDLEVKVLETSPKTLYLTLPPTAEEQVAGELSDAQLERVAGGTAGYTLEVQTVCALTSWAGEPNWC